MIAKRLFDVAISLLGLMVLLPLFLMIGLWIRLDSRGPIFFRQERVGLHGRVFRIHKFRTMCVETEDDGPQITGDKDPRITRAGRFLRKLKLDELPQLIDVLLGRMSLVGPRPEVPKYMALYPEDTRLKVLSVRPGITDWASLRFRNESAMLEQATDIDEAYVEQVLPIKRQLYVEYVESRSFWGDMKIIVATARTLMKGA